MDGAIGNREVLTDSFDLPLACARAFRLFTARGERLWVDGWDPRIFADGADDTAVGTVFQTRDAAGRATTWVVVDAHPPLEIRYARVADSLSSGTVHVMLAERATGCTVTVTYDLTATSREGARTLERFADEYPEFLAAWRDDIVEFLDREPNALESVPR